MNAPYTDTLLGRWSDTPAIPKIIALLSQDREREFSVGEIIKATGVGKTT